MGQLDQPNPTCTAHPAHPAPVAARSLAHRTTSSLAATEEFFQREYVEAGKDLHAIAAETGISRRWLARRARYLGFHVPRAPYTPPIDPNWLREQAETRHRTNGDIAAELGLTGETIRRWRRLYGIASRPIGGHGHTVTYLHHPTLPTDIRRAVEGQRTGWQRLHRFQQMMTYPSMNSAAAALGLHTRHLNLQLQRLEADIGARLLQRAPHRYAPMTPTRRGQRLLDHLDRPAIRELLHRYAGANARPKIGPYNGTASSKRSRHDGGPSTRTPTAHV